MTLWRYYWESEAEEAAPPPPEPATYSEIILALTPTGYWDCQDASGNLVDSSGGGRNATASGSSTYLASGPTINGVAHSAVQFSGTSYFSIVGTFPNPSPARTISCWVYLPSTSSVAGNFVARIATNNREFSLKHASNGALQFNAYQSDGNTVVATASDADLDGGTWKHILGWWDDSDQDVYTQIDGGTPVSAAGSTNIKTDSTRAIGIGATDSGTDPLRSGARIAHVAIWGRVLNSTERTQLATGVE
jgi:hypothetical protein